MKSITIKSATTHNLKNIDIEIPRNKITVIVGVSGSGKSTIAYDIIAAEGQRQFLESISTFAARLLKRTGKAEINSIKNLSPTIAIDQKKLRGNPRSTVGTSTEIYTSLRLLFSRFGFKKNLDAGHFSFNNPKGACKTCKGLGKKVEFNEKEIADFNKSLNEGALKPGDWKVNGRQWNIVKSTGHFDMDKKLSDWSREKLDQLFYSDPEVISEEYSGFVQKWTFQGIIERMKRRNSNLNRANTLKDKNYLIENDCDACHGGRLNNKALSSKINKKNIGEISNLELNLLIKEIKKIKIPEARELTERIIETTQNLINVDLGYLSLNRSLDTLSGGESQRLKLARELGSDLIEMVYILDEPTTGLHPKDRNNLINILHQLKKAKNTVIVVEHDDLVMQNANHIIEIGPGAGREGGEIIFKGSFKDLKSKSPLTGKYFDKKTTLEQKVRKAKDYLKIKNASINNLKNVSVKIPKQIFCSITGVSGSGKSSLIIDHFIKQFPKEKIILIDQSPLTGTARGNIATYTGIFNEIRTLFTKENQVSASLFSFNSKGACQECKGLGFKNINMHFMGDVKSLCETCQGKKYKKETLKYKYQDKNIYEVLEMTVNQANDFFKNNSIKNKLKMLIDVGLGYLTLGQTHDTFSGGEAQRLKLASKLEKKGEIFILDEPTTGLHFKDIENLLNLLNKITDNGNSVIVIEHNLDVIKQSDWIIDMGQGGGENGGRVVAEGTPLEVSKNKNSITGTYLLK
jgi:excinuclease ABC A subunit